RGAVRLIVEIATATIATRPRVHFLMSSLLVRSVILPLPSRNLAWPDEAPIVSFLHHVVPALAVRVVHHHRVAPGDLHHRAERLGVVGDDEEIERPRELHRLAGGRHDLFAAGEAIRLLRSER